MTELTIEEWVYLEINEDLRVSVRIRFPKENEISDKDKINLARYHYLNMTFKDVTRAA